MSGHANSAAASPERAYMNDAVRAVLEAPDPRVKAALARQAHADWSRDALGVDTQAPSNWPDRPARPDRPALLAPRDMPTRKLGSEKGRAVQIHALAHIELNAIDLACDMAGRFCAHGLDNSFYGDWLSIAADEARHFLMLEKRLKDRALPTAISRPMMAFGKPLMTHAMTLRRALRLCQWFWKRVAWM